MNLLYALFFGAGTAGLAYTTIGRRVGYGNKNNVWTLVGVIFVVATIVFLTVFAFLL